MLNQLKWLLFAILSCSATSCATLPPPPDVFAFEHLGQRLYTDPVTQHLILEPSPTCLEKIAEAECGHGVSIMTGQEVYVGDAKPNLWKGKPWSTLHSESILLPAVESYAPLETYLINACKRFNCNTALDAFRVKINSLNGIVGAITNH